MSKTFQPDSLHPYIMDARLKKATGSGGISNIPIASADTVGGIMIGGSANPITVTGSGNASVRKATSELLGVVKAGDGVTIDADGAISGVSYSTTEHKTGRKWTDGKDIYEKVIHSDVGYNISTSGTVIEENSNIETVTHAACNTTGGYAPIQIGNASNTIRAYAIGSTLSGIKDIIIEYTKITTP